jgi:NAD(P)-dependent dehydrogenase (short-subunit alcohol dehydrogenase family)
VGTIVLTGASDGIGAAAAVELTQLGHTVLATGRSQEKLAAVRARMVDTAPEGVDVPEPIAIDLATMAGVRDLAAQVLERCPTVDVLANNAGLQTRRRETSPDGFELVLAVNHLAPFLLTNLLLQRVQASDGRVITTSSSAHRAGRIDFDDLQMERRWGGFRAYGRSKLANIWFTSELARRTGVAATCYHPGGVNTALNRESSVANTLQPFVARFMRTPETGADTLVWLATSDEGAHPSAVYYADRKPGRMSNAAHDTAAAARLWDVSAQLVGIT